MQRQRAPRFSLSGLFAFARLAVQALPSRAPNRSPCRRGLCQGRGGAPARRGCQHHPGKSPVPRILRGKGSEVGPGMSERRGSGAPEPGGGRPYERGPRPPKMAKQSKRKTRIRAVIRRGWAAFPPRAAPLRAARQAGSASARRRDFRRTARRPAFRPWSCGEEPTWRPRRSG